MFCAMRCVPCSISDRYPYHHTHTLLPCTWANRYVKLEIYTIPFVGQHIRNCCQRHELKLRHTTRPSPTREHHEHHSHHSRAFQDREKENAKTEAGTVGTRRSSLRSKRRSSSVGTAGAAAGPTAGTNGHGTGKNGAKKTSGEGRNAMKEQKAAGGGNTGGGAGGGTGGGEMSPLTGKGRTALKGGIRRAILSTLEVRVESKWNEQHTCCCCCCYCCCCCCVCVDFACERREMRWRWTLK